MIDWFLGDFYVLIGTCVADFVKRSKRRKIDLLPPSVSQIRFLKAVIQKKISASIFPKKSILFLPYHIKL